MHGRAQALSAGGSGESGALDSVQEELAAAKQARADMMAQLAAAKQKLASEK